MKRYIGEGMVLCMNFYVKVWKIDGDHQIGKKCTKACMYVLVSLSMCVQSVSQISLKAHDETKKVKKWHNNLTNQQTIMFLKNQVLLDSLFCTLWRIKKYTR